MPYQHLPDARVIVTDLERRAHIRGWSIAELCRRANVARTIFFRAKNGTNSPRLVSLKRLYEALETE